MNCLLPLYPYPIIHYLREAGFEVRGVVAALYSVRPACSPAWGLMAETGKMTDSDGSRDPVDEHIIAKFASKATSMPAKSMFDLAEGEVPVGVDVLADDQPLNAEFHRLLRQPRYFDENYTPGAAISCWKCGRRGHLSRDCTFIRNKPCVLCAQYGHESASCPYRKL